MAANNEKIDANRANVFNFISKSPFVVNLNAEVGSLN